MEHAHEEGKYKFSRSTTWNVIGVLYENTKQKKTKLLIITIKS